MKIRYTVTVIPKAKRKRKKNFHNVYDIGHYYQRNTTEAAEVFRLLIGDPFGETEREYIDLMKNDVLIHLEDWKGEQE